MRPILVDVRGLQGAASGVGSALLREGRAALADRILVGLVDPALPPLDPALRACLDRVCTNAQAGRRAAPSCFVVLAPREDDALFTASLLLDRAIPSIGVEARRPGPGLEGAIASYWRARVGRVVAPPALWGCAGSAEPGPAAAPRLAVFAASPALAVCQALRRQGASVFGPSPLPLLAPAFDRALFVLTNQAATAALLLLLRRQGGAALVLDACLLAAYPDDARLRALAEAELGRDVPATELRQWREGIARPEALLLGEVAAAADVLLVHSAWLADAIARRYRRAAVVVPPAADPPRIYAEAAGLQAEACVWAVEMLRFWGVAVRLDLVCPAAERPALRALAMRLGIDDWVGFAPGPASVALLLAMRGQTRLPFAAAGTPCIVSRSVAQSAALAGMVAIVPDQPSPPLLAEAIHGALPEPAPDGVPQLLAALGIVA